MRHIDPCSQTASDNYKLLTNLVVPRPIAWVTSRNVAGIINLAPFSFFNAIASNPLYLMISVAKNADGSDKDTAKNIIENGEFVVNLVTEELLEAMNLSAADFPENESELSATSLHTTAACVISVPRVAEARASLECKLHRAELLGGSWLIIAQVVMFNVAEDLIDDNLHIHGFAPIGRLGSPSFYCRTTDRFALQRLNYANWRAKQYKFGMAAPHAKLNFD